MSLHIISSTKTFEIEYVPKPAPPILANEDARFARKTRPRATLEPVLQFERAFLFNAPGHGHRAAGVSAFTRS